MRKTMFPIDDHLPPKNRPKNHIDDSVALKTMRGWIAEDVNLTKDAAAMRVIAEGVVDTKEIDVVNVVRRLVRKLQYELLL